MTRSWRTLLARRRSYRAWSVAAAVLACGVLAAGVVLATIPDASGVIHGCYTKSGGAVRIIDNSVTNCKASETAISWSVTGPAGPTGATGPAGPAGPAGAPGAPGAGIDWTKVYKVDSANVTVFPNVIGSANADCRSGDVAVGGNFGVNGQNFLVYFAGTHIIPDKVGSTTDLAGYYGFSVRNNNPAGGATILIFSTVYCLPPA